jgi:hypothetical protein
MSEKKNFGSRVLEKVKGIGKRKGQGQSEGSPSNSQRASVDSGPAPIDTPSSGQRAREAAILLLDLGSTISEATEVLKPMKVVCGFIKKILEVAKVSISLLISTPSGLITISLLTKIT